MKKRLARSHGETRPADVNCLHPARGNRGELTSFVEAWTNAPCVTWLTAALIATSACATTAGLPAATSLDGLASRPLASGSLATSIGSPAPSRDESQAAPESPQTWRFQLAPLLWFASVEGDGGDGSGPPVDIDAEGSLFGNINGGFMLAFDARAPDDRYSLLADGLWLSLEDDEGALNTNTDAVMIEVGGGLPLGEAKLWEALAGLRYVDLQFDADIGPVSTRAEEAWVDPWVGLRGRIPITGRWDVSLRGDIGGFGVGTEFTWQTFGAIGAKLGDSVRLDLGYRAIGLDKDDDELHYDALIHGAQIALAVVF